MKKLTVIFAAVMLAFTLVACGGEKENAEAITSETESAEAASQTTEPEIQTTVQTVTELTADEAARLFNEAYVQAEKWYGFSNEYWDKSDYFTGDNEYDYYYLINHDTVKTLNDLKAHLCNYFSAYLVDELVDSAYAEKDGKLYHHCFIAGDAMPVYMLDDTTAELVSAGEEYVTFDITVKADRSMFAEEGEDQFSYFTNSIEFVYENGKWLIDNHFSISLYPPYEWNEN